MKLTIKYFLITIFIFVFSLHALAQNMVVNGSFDKNIDDWDYNFNNAIWISDDGATISGNGSLRYGRVILNNSFIYTESIAMTARAGFTYEVGVSAKIPLASAANHLGVLILWFNSDDNLIDGQFYFTSEILPFPMDNWIDMHATVQAPELTNSAKIWLTTEVGGSGDPEEAFGLWDDIFMLQDTVFINGFD